MRNALKEVGRGEQLSVVSWLIFGSLVSKKGGEKKHAYFIRSSFKQTKHDIFSDTGHYDYHGGNKINLDFPAWLPDRTWFTFNVFCRYKMRLKRSHWRGRTDHYALLEKCDYSVVNNLLY